MQRRRSRGEDARITILGATSGDTGEIPGPGGRGVYTFVAVFVNYLEAYGTQSDFIYRISYKYSNPSVRGFFFY